MKIAMFTDAYFPRVNGVAVSVKSYSEQLVKVGHSVYIVCCDYDCQPNLNPLNAGKIRYEYPLGENKNLVLLRIPSDPIVFSKEDRQTRLNQWWNIKHSLDEISPDVVHINTEFVMGWYGVIYSRHRRIPMVFTFHTLWEDYIENYVKALPRSASQKVGREMVKFYLKRADEIIVPTERIGEVARRYGIDRPYDILPTGIQDDFLKTDVASQAEWLEKIYGEFPALRDSEILLYVGRVVKEKNLDFLYGVLERIKPSHPDARLLIVGGGPWLEGLRELAEEKGCSDSVIFTDYRPREELVHFYHMAKIFTFPSVTETQGLVTVEAMMTGLPVVAIGEMGTIDVMRGDNGGFMVPNDTEIFSEKVLALLDNPELHRSKSEEARAWGKKWSLSELTPRLVAYYEKAIEIRQSLKTHSD